MMIGITLMNAEWSINPAVMEITGNKDERPLQEEIRETHGRGSKWVEWLRVQRSGWGNS